MRARGHLNMHKKVRKGRLLERLSAAGLIALGLVVPSVGWATDHGAPEVVAEIKHDVSPPLQLARASSPGAETQRDKPLRPIPQNLLVNNADDPVVQQARGPLVSTSIGLNFAGVGQGDYGFV